MVSPREEAGEGGIPRVAMSPLTSTLSAEVGCFRLRPRLSAAELGQARGRL
jgi:hypothetical protein